MTTPHTYGTWSPLGYNPVPEDLPILTCWFCEFVRTKKLIEEWNLLVANPKNTQERRYRATHYTSKAEEFLGSPSKFSFILSPFLREANGEPLAVCEECWRLHTSTLPKRYPFRRRSLHPMNPGLHKYNRRVESGRIRPPSTVTHKPPD